MYGPLSLLTLLTLAQAEPPAHIPAWPEVRPGSIIETPNWADYRLYPLPALRKDQEGRVTAELLVGADGSPQQCRIVTTSFFDELDSGTCELMLKMRFSPARDDQGNAVPSRFVKRFNWRLTGPRKFESAYLVARVSLNDGNVEQCEVTEGAGSYLTFWSSTVCSFLTDAGYYYNTRQSGEALVEFRLDAGDGADFLETSWASKDAGAAERISFVINESGDASQCTALEQYGFGPRGLNNLSPCGRLLSILWFEKAPANTPPRKGTFETRVSF